MKTKIRNKLANEKKKIEKQLKSTVNQEREKPMFSDSTITYEMAERTHAIAHGGIGAIHQMVGHVGLAKQIDKRLHLLQIHKPYHESDHVLNLAYNPLCGGRVIEDIELRRNDAVYLDALGAESIPDPTTAGDFCRRFEKTDIQILMDTINDCRVELWRQQPQEFFDDFARIDADGTMVPTTGECKEGMDIGHKGEWGYHPLLLSFANTQEPLFIENRSGNRPSHEGAAKYYDKAIKMCREAGFESIMLRGDTDFSQTKHLDGWDDDGVSFVFGYDAKKNLKDKADSIDESEYWELVRQAERAIKTKPRRRPRNVKERVVRHRWFKNLVLDHEDVTEFMYKPVACKREHLMVAVRKTIKVLKGQQHLFDEIRYFFYISNCVETHTSVEIVAEANQRCNQENLIEQLKNGARAFHAPVNTLNANWAYMVMTSLAWTLKAWMGHSLPVAPRWRSRHLAEKRRILTMEFRTFVNSLITMPCQIVRTGRKLVYRLLSFNPCLPLFFRFVDALKT